jgi:hypothetical protein
MSVQWRVTVASALKATMERPTFRVAVASWSRVLGRALVALLQIPARCTLHLLCTYFSAALRVLDPVHTVLSLSWAIA